MPRFSDMLYGNIELPEWIVPFIKSPEFVRLRGVRLSNVDSYEFKDFSAPSRWEHGIGVSYLALECAKERNLELVDTVKLVLAALLHDVATPPFAHTVEYVLDHFDHEIETRKILGEVPSENTNPWVPVFKSALPRFRLECERISKRLSIKLNADEVSDLVIGEGDLGYLISGTLDLDNADNVIRGCMYLGLQVDRDVPLQLARWLAQTDRPPTDLDREEHEAIKKWVQYRREYYGAFFSSSVEELGRQAYLQHLIRRAVNAGLPRRVCIWNTDHGLLHAMASIDESPRRGWESISGLVERYVLLESTVLLAAVDLYSNDELSKLQNPLAADWIEQELSSDYLECFVMVSARRGGSQTNAELLPSPLGRLYVFKLGNELSWKQLPKWVSKGIIKNTKGIKLKAKVREVVAQSVEQWVNQQPWFKISKKRGTRLTENLDSIGDWSFRMSRNESLHAYPGTFVHAIPATLLSVLGLKGETVLDPFGGTGQTAVEVARCGGRAISGDSSFVATLAARAKLTYLDKKQREFIFKIEGSRIENNPEGNVPEFELRDKWHHGKTLSELSRIKNYIDSLNDAHVKTFLLAAFSAIIPLSTGRRGKEHGWFADNTPLKRGEATPPYQNAIELFLKKLKLNIAIIDRFYASIESDERDPKDILSKFIVVQKDVTNNDLSGYGVEEGTVRGIITSPPYLCMADYTLGQRLSYYWIKPNALLDDFEKEIAPRRSRFSPVKAEDAYFENIQKFLSNSRKLLTINGYLAMVLGEPSAKAFTDASVLDRVNDIAKCNGFNEIWSTWRPINWHRNQGYQKLRKERIMVFGVDK